MASRSMAAFASPFELSTPRLVSLSLEHYVPKTEHYVLDGGSLLHRLKWTEGSTYSSIADAYTSFTVASYGKATVIFDGYGEPSTKDITHTRRKTIVGKR